MYQFRCSCNAGAHVCIYAMVRMCATSTAQNCVQDVIDLGFVTCCLHVQVYTGRRLLQERSNNRDCHCAASWTSCGKQYSHGLLLLQQCSHSCTRCTGDCALCSAGLSCLSPRYNMHLQVMQLLHSTLHACDTATSRHNMAELAYFVCLCIVGAKTLCCAFLVGA